MTYEEIEDYLSKNSPLFLTHNKIEKCNCKNCNKYIHIEVALILEQLKQEEEEYHGEA